MPLALVLIDAFDELASGLPSASAYELQRSFDVEVAALVGAVFTLPQLMALLVEGPFLVWAERWPRKRLLVGGLLGMAIATLACGVAPGIWGVAIGCTLFFPASGVACGIAQAALMDSDPARREQRMAEWAMAGWAGDLLTPMFLALSSDLGFGWRGAFLVVAALLCLAAWAASKVTLPRFADDLDEAEADLDLRQKLSLLLGEPRLLWWLCGVTLCSLLDEIFAVFAGIRISQEAGPLAVATTLTTFTAGGVAGLLVTKPLLRALSPHSVLLISCVGCMFTWLGWLAWGASPAGLVMVFACGLCVAFQYPLAQAAAYRALPGRSTLVAAAGSVFGAVELAMPLALGWVVDGFGEKVALVVLLLQPVGLFTIALWCGATRREAS